MSNVSEVNLRDLESRYILSRHTATARKMLAGFYEGSGAEDLDYLLRRHHPEAPISNRETWDRDSFDYLIGAYGILEIASLIAVVPDPVPPRVGAPALLHLSHPAVRRYYESHYRLLLPRLFRLRLEGKYEAREERGATTASLFMRFLDLHDYMEADPQVENFLWLLDGGYRKVNLDDVLKAFKDKDTFLKVMTRPLTKHKLGSQTRRDRDDQLTFSLLGMQKFFWFCLEFEVLLDEATALPRLQSAFWFAYEYWFSHLRNKVGRTLPLAVERIKGWVDYYSDSEAGSAGGVTADQMKKTLSRLTSDEFRQGLAAPGL